MKIIKVICTECKGTNVEYKVWYNPNKKTYDHMPTGDECYCSDCQKTTELDYIEETVSDDIYEE